MGITMLYCNISSPFLKVYAGLSGWKNQVQRVPPERDEPFLHEARGHAQRGALDQKPAAGGGGRQGPHPLQVSAVQQVFQGGPDEDIYQPLGDHA